MRRVADSLDIEVDERAWADLVAAKGGSESFFSKGTNGRRREVLTEDDLELYEVAVERLDPELHAWLERGTAGAGSPQAR